MNCIITDPQTGLNSSIACNFNNGSVNLISGQVEYTAYEYIVNKPSVYAFLALFSVAAVAHIMLGIYWKRWWTLATLALGTAVEAVGWGGRLWSVLETRWDPNQGGQWWDYSEGFTQQIVCLIIAPTFYSAANYILLGRIIKYVGPEYSSLSPKSFSVFFTIADVVCLVIQGIGGGSTGEASSFDQTKNGLHIMAVGVIAQLVVTFIFAGFLIETLYRIIRNRPTARSIDLLRPFRFLGKMFQCCGSGNRRRNASAIEMAEAQQIARGDQNGPNALGASTPASEAKGSTWSGVGTSAKKPFIVKAFLAAVSFTTILIIVRSEFRCEELLGYNGTATGAYADQMSFIAKDASLMLGLSVTYLIFHPGRLEGQSLF